jgi:hypothetical protein
LAAEGVAGNRVPLLLSASFDIRAIIPNYYFKGTEISHRMSSLRNAGPQGYI